MDIPTKSVKIGEKEVEVREYLTQGQEDERMELLSGGRDISITPGQEVTFTTNMSAVNNARTFLVKALCVNLTPDEYGTMPPKHRRELDEILEGLVGDEKKAESPISSS